MGIVDNLENALNYWSTKLTEIWGYITQSPEFMGGAIWEEMKVIHDVLQGLALGILVVCFLAGVFKTTATMAEFKRPEVAVKALVRFVLARILVVYGLELMMALLNIAQGIISTIITEGGFTPEAVILPQEIKDAVADIGFIDRVFAWILTLIGSLMVLAQTFVMALTVMGRFFRLYMYIAVSPIAMATFGGEPTSQYGKSFLRSFAGVALEGVIIVLVATVKTADRTI